MRSIFRQARRHRYLAAMSWRGSPRTARSRNGQGTGALYARIDNCGAKVLFEAATGRFF
jgi:hypothetical protein